MWVGREQSVRGKGRILPHASSSFSAIARASLLLATQLGKQIYQLLRHSQNSSAPYRSIFARKSISFSAIARAPELPTIPPREAHPSAPFPVRHSHFPLPRHLGISPANPCLAFPRLLTRLQNQCRNHLRYSRPLPPPPFHHQWQVPSMTESLELNPPIPCSPTGPIASWAGFSSRPNSDLKSFPTFRHSMLS